MSHLINNSRNVTLAKNVIEARTFYAQAKGLLGRKELARDTTLWIHAGGSVHTFFMQFAIDVIYVDRDLIVKAVHRNVPPWRLVPRARKASSVFEFAAGVVQPGQVEVGDQLHVGA